MFHVVISISIDPHETASSIYILFIIIIVIIIVSSELGLVRISAPVIAIHWSDSANLGGDESGDGTVDP